ncbi:MAG: hypothetical protein QOJ63_3120 [Solirubrobacteraceae bacterium]|nr:hypothetical protein [Solirubrobacteraceae bacterium]
MLALAGAPGAAVAASPSATGYSGTASASGYSETGANVPPATGRSATGGTRSASAKGGQLPFTGADIGLAGLGGVILLSLGFVLRRTTRVTP